MPTGITSPPPSPCTARNAINAVADHARPHSSELAPNVATAAMNTRRVPNRSTAHPATGIMAASVSRYAVETHWIVASCASKATASRSIATFTIVESRIVIAAPQTTTAAAASTGRPRSRIPPRILTRAWGAMPAQR